eukprot:TRINITY_DN21401_c0_g1_i1.p1 TRINITY_DN21401_c0_g1~~TRINITY_DN21401_c0_g1_i1.p1  ORF type:complete len:413 (+),score=179.37 TRINITY_DN21401_c0_g1_i1:83-1240(+)
MIAGTDTAFLKEELGPVLARGLAETVCAAPEDPVEYLGLWLQHFLQEKEYAAKERALEEELQKQRAEWNRSRQTKEKAACQVIQHNWKEHRAREDQEAQREEELRQRIADFTTEEVETDERFDPEAVSPDDVLDKDAKPAEVEEELEMLKAERSFMRWNAYVRKLTKENIASIKMRQRVPDHVAKIVRCCFYMLGKLPARTAGGDRADATPGRVRSWAQLRANIKPYLFLLGLQELDPCVKRGEVDPPTKRRINRVRRILDGAGLTEEAIKKDPRDGGGGTAVWVLWQWLRTAVDWRTLRDEVFKAKKRDGKGPFGENPNGKKAGDPTGGLQSMDTWEEDPGEEDEAEEKDPDEEAQKAIEEAERAAAAAEEGGEEDGGGGGDDE